MTNLHWAAKYVGLPWLPDGEGPDEFSCWGLVREVFRQQHGIVMPPIRMGEFSEGENVAAIKQAAQGSGFRIGDPSAQLDDIVLMRAPDNSRHVGVVVSPPALLLHSWGQMTDRGPVGSVVVQPLSDLRRQGYREFEHWRRR